MENSAWGVYKALLPVVIDCNFFYDASRHNAVSIDRPPVLRLWESTSFAMRPFIFLFGIFIACSASLTKRKCNPDPDDCKTGLLQFNTCHVSKNQREKQGIDQDLFDKLRFFSQIAAASYWPGNNNSTGDLLKCSGDSCPNIPEDNCPDVENSEYTTVSEWQDVAQFDDHGKLLEPK